MEAIVAVVLMWWSPAFPCRIPVTVHVGKATAYDVPVVVPVDFTKGFQKLGKRDAEFDPGAVRVVEYSPEGKVIPGKHGVPCQFEPAEKFEPSKNAVGDVVWVAKGRPGGPKERQFVIYFDVAGGKPKPDPGFEGLVVEDELEEPPSVARFETTYGTFSLAAGPYPKGGFRGLKTPEGEGVGVILVPSAQFGWIGTPGSGGKYGGRSPSPKVAELRLVCNGPVRAVYAGDPVDGYQYIIYHRGGVMVRQQLTGEDRILGTKCTCVFGRGIIESGGKCYFASDGDFVPTQFAGGKDRKIVALKPDFTVLNTRKGHTFMLAPGGRLLHYPNSRSTFEMYLHNTNFAYLRYTSRNFDDGYDEMDAVMRFLKSKKPFTVGEPEALSKQGG